MPLFDGAGPPGGAGPQTGRQMGLLNRQQPRQGPPPVNFESVDAERAASLAQGLGMHRDFVEGVRRAGMEAVLQRTEATDSTGARVKVLRLVQAVGTWLETRTARGKPTDQKLLHRAVGKEADALDMNRDEATEIVMGVLKKYQETTQALGKGGGDAGTSRLV